MIFRPKKIHSAVVCHEQPGSSVEVKHQEEMAPSENCKGMYVLVKAKSNLTSYN
jgi:hypothetical protein